MVSVRARPNNGLSPDSPDTHGHRPGQAKTGPGQPGQPGHMPRKALPSVRFASTLADPPIGDIRVLEWKTLPIL